MKKYSLLLMLAMGVSFASAQTTEKIGDAHVSNYRDWAVGVHVGNMFTGGDLSSFSFNDEDNDFQFELGFGLDVTKYLNSVWGIKAQGMYGNISGTNGLNSFESKYFDYSLNAVMNLNSLVLRAKQNDRRWATLVSLGIGMSQTQALRSFNGVEVAQYGKVGDENWTNEVFIPMDVTFKYRLSNLLDLDFGVQGKYLFSDIADGFAGGRNNDMIVYSHVGLSFNFGGPKESTAVIYTNPLDGMYFDLAEVKDNFDQLTTDDDKDGVNNYFDKDNSTPEGAVVDGSGKALDVDQDGIPDNMDEDPFTAKGAKVDANGRAVDSDGDGVADYMDKEANTPAGTMVNFQGQTIKGGMDNAFIPSVYFSFNSASISAANHQRLATIARLMKNNPNTKIVVTGSADPRGSEEYNKNLGMRRAEAVKKQLSQVYGIDEARIEAKSVGESEQFANGRNDINRRADITIK
ncbi:outer membrane protein/peptidoglycan-associated (lipo)protein [Owenweeksia hongkongensis DSM 17368]|uniref:Outer membrane protein/peptidoglycan-associated (Lipo)protein n=1 Tax=Owenweeksia hongkongensis (strain DSM 17368 / CIP 108786 / JCM 12287 / NRRL B-23963 / UST20020801) TaxID=926562 RepID=G8R1Y9_OWEHD|nr:OmpA family protein [Owenweeksia hongkongensis]AEV33939.1 outer membrane protein/peptidoglycan-associated (lipo)protein [Owenweeksia hongkongensis DSM 17368]